MINRVPYLKRHRPDAILENSIGLLIEKNMIFIFIVPDFKILYSEIYTVFK